ncbi:MAG: hypothetical protein AAAFM81_02980 [Pseudomonadota bacterium]
MFWFEDIRARLGKQIRDDTLPHALMIAGRRGLGKRAFAFELAATLLDVPLTTSEGQPNEQWIVAPDFYWLKPIEGKRQISIEQVRSLTEQLSLSAHASRKVAIVDAANQMTLAAANALLKTLEEPQGNAALVLLADDLSRIPATIMSRCVKLRVALPKRSESLSWLKEQGFDSEEADIALAQHLDAPMAAADALRDGSAQLLATVWKDAQAIAAGQAEPLAVSARWRKLPFESVLGALGVLVRQLIYPKDARMRSVSGFDHYVIDTKDAFWYLEKLNGISRMTPGSFNADIALDALLIPWRHGLRSAQN